MCWDLPTWRCVYTCVCACMCVCCSQGCYYKAMARRHIFWPLHTHTHTYANCPLAKPGWVDRMIPVWPLQPPDAQRQAVHTLYAQCYHLATHTHTDTHGHTILLLIFKLTQHTFFLTSVFLAPEEKTCFLFSSATFVTQSVSKSHRHKRRLRL